MSALTADFYANPPTSWFEPGPDDWPRLAANPATETAGERLAEQRADAWRYATNDDAPRGWEP